MNSTQDFCQDLWPVQEILQWILFPLLHDIGRRKTKLFWVTAGAPLISIILSTLLVFVIQSPTSCHQPIWKFIGRIEPLSWNMLHFHGSNLRLVIKIGLVTGIISLAEGMCSRKNIRCPKELPSGWKQKR